MHPKVRQKYNQNAPNKYTQMHPKCVQNVSKMHQKCTQNACTNASKNVPKMHKKYICITLKMRLGTLTIFIAK